MTLSNDYEEDFNILWKNNSKVLSQLNYKKIVIIGSTGMICSYLSKLLIWLVKEKDFSCNIYLHGRSLEKLSNVFGMQEDKKIKFVTFDVTEIDRLEDDFDYIIHGASPASAWFIKNKPVEVIIPNILGGYKCLEYARKNKHTKVLFLSSYTVYGKTEKSLVQENDYGIVDFSLPKNCYIEAKRMTEQLCTSYALEYNVDSKIVRIVHTYGPSFDINNDTRIIPSIIKKIVNKENIEIYHDEMDYTQYTYVGDIAMAILYVLLFGKQGESYNACSDEVVRVRKLIELMVKSDNRIVSSVNEKEQDQYYNFINKNKEIYSKIDNEKLKSLNWKESFGIEKGVYSMMKYYLDKYAM